MDLIHPNPPATGASEEPGILVEHCEMVRNIRQIALAEDLSHYPVAAPGFIGRPPAQAA
ncbi:hypothetical protein AB0L75_27890 [Streptomyces sp. NPDC052101]|uniref:hypothetical protein n=1 Tax=Streptomyces sp. NPDC052101 TaxID=3155763 RepID=UPI0034293D5C